jgi:DNA ligase-1
MLAADVDLNKLVYPCLASVKLDGIRAVVRDGIVYSRSNKPIPNRYVQKTFSHLNYFDGELIVGEPTNQFCYRTTMSGVMSEFGEPIVGFYVFDHIQYPAEPFFRRNALIVPDSTQVVRLNQRLIHTFAELEEFEEKMLTLGYEGLILRDSMAPYKMGRSTVREGCLLKLKRFADSEFVVVDFKERMHNTNEAKQDERGYTHRSSHQEGKIRRGDLGALVVTDGEVTFDCGSGFCDAERAEIWANKAKYLNKIAKVKYFLKGAYDVPRHPTFLGWRTEELK